ncbi:hypothetical protein SAMN04487819_1253 [Actinopolyspora alba]|uniref:Uncharacterized protein n=1 Tax=Actinopolyspora alba TaxID=673379 RepID=A0A1I2CL48_9ACTN|nr:hypothetical protein [Actinopolyspora alba]SFE68875.1 hypothetical protein SAMN04487819_1253 [Actinopolyspora alba]
MSPIRSNRGRAAAWRSVWSWPLHSRGRALITLVVVVGVLLAVGQLSTRDTQHEQSSGTGPAATTSTPVPATRSDDTTDPAAEASRSALPAPSTVRAVGKDAPPAALEAAGGFMRNWINTPEGIEPEQWRDGLEPYAMPELSGQLRSVDPARVTPSELVGDPRVVRASPPVVEVHWPTDTDTVRLVLIHPEGTWRVRDVGVAA